MITWRDFTKIDSRAGKMVKAELFEGAKKPTFRLWVDLGSGLGIKKSSAQITSLYQPKYLIDKQVVCVINFPPKQIADFISEVFVIGFPTEQGHVVLTSVDKSVPNGARLYQLVHL